MKEEKKYLTNHDFDLLSETLLTMPDFENEEYELSKEIKSKVYHCSNERLNAYFKDLKLKDSRVATVGSSGDQVLNAIFYGAKDITLIDANIFTKAYYEYKVAMIKNLDFKTFTHHLGRFSMFNWKTYSKISHDLSNKTKQFFDELMLNQDDNGHDYDEGYLTDSLIRNNLFHTPCTDHDSVQENLFYNNEKDYLKLKELLIKNDFELKFINAELKEFPSKLKGEFDFIFLSNIYDYVDTNVFLKILNKLHKKIKVGGKIQYHYEFNTFNINLIAKTAYSKILQKPRIDYFETEHLVHFIDKTEDENFELSI